MCECFMSYMSLELDSIHNSSNFFSKKILQMGTVELFLSRTILLFRLAITKMHQNSAIEKILSISFFIFNP